MATPDMNDAETDAVEMPTTRLWRQQMTAGRKALGLTQTELGERVGLSQPTISDIESGVMKGSRLIPAIARALFIPPPFLAVEDELDDRLMRAGRELRSRNNEVFLAQLQLLETLVKSIVAKG
jgi:transcriptional regulator with XRE-family HTH domain